MKEIDIYIWGKVRRDVIDGTVPHLFGSPNKRNRYNILATVALKKPDACHALLFEETTDVELFFQFVLTLLSTGFLVAGDKFIVDNCSVHMNGRNSELQERLLRDAGITMISLPPYHPECNPTEFVFNYVLQEMRRKAMRWNSLTTEQYEANLRKVLYTISYEHVRRFYEKMGYKTEFPMIERKHKI